MTALSDVTFKKGQEVELTIDSVSFGGQGVARVDGFVVFVSGGYSGDRVLARIQKKKKNFAEARTLRILTPSPRRVTAPCRHFGICGGCKMQDLDYAAQLEIKRANVTEVFRHIGTFGDLDVPAPLPSEKVFAYRNKMEFTFGDRRWRIDETDTDDDGFALGFHVPQRYDKIVMIDECHLASDRVNKVLRFMQDVARSSGRVPYSVETNEGFWRFVVVRESYAGADMMVNVITSEEDSAIQEKLRDGFSSQLPFVTSLINGITSRKSQVAISEKEILLLGNNTITEKLGEYSFQISPTSFFQTNTRSAETLYETALKMAEFRPEDTVFDLYCGTGSIAIYISRYAKEIIGIELVEDAVRDARKNAERNGVKNCLFHAGDLKQVVQTLDRRPDVVIVDPPRAGLHPDVVRAMIDWKPRRIVYVSCNPATQARDAALLCSDGYALTAMQPVDMFPHTFHIENVAQFTRVP